MSGSDDRAWMPTASDLAELLGLVAVHQDRQAFAALFRFYAPRLKSFLLRQGFSDSECEDLIQEAMLNVWRRAASFDIAKAGVSTWIFTIARNAGIDRRRREARALQPAYEDPVEEFDPAPSAEGELISRQNEAQVRAALERLPPDQATVIRLSYYSDNPQSEISKALGIPLGTVKSRMRLALQRLRQLMEERE